MRVLKMTMGLATASLIASTSLAFAQGTRSGEGVTGSSTESSIVNGNRTMSGKTSGGHNTMGTDASGTAAPPSTGTRSEPVSGNTSHN